ncbi:MAG: hypothetical protein MMC23_007680 [Stictis urceolatum]|nr:hypothetical protein [Stictis urceolata]
MKLSIILSTLSLATSITALLSAEKPAALPEPNAGPTLSRELQPPMSNVVIEALPSGHTFTAVSGTSAVPTPTPATSSASGSWYGPAWVGIDGDTYDTATCKPG